MNLSMSDMIRRQDAINEAIKDGAYGYISTEELTRLPSAEPLTEEDYTELRDRFGEYVEFIVRDMITGKGERWK